MPKMSNRGVLILQNETPREQEAMSDKVRLSAHDLLNQTHDRIILKKIVKRNPDDSFFENLSQKIEDLAYPSEASFKPDRKLGKAEVKLPKLRHSIGDGKNLAAKLQKRLHNQQTSQ